MNTRVHKKNQLWAKKVKDTNTERLINMLINIQEITEQIKEEFTKKKEKKRKE